MSKKKTFELHDVVCIKGAIVHVYQSGKKYVVEFPNPKGKPLIVTLDESQLRR